MNLNRTFSTAALWAVSIVQAATPDALPHQEFVCVRGAEQRVVALYNQSNEHSTTGCRVEYTKAGHTQVLWSSQAARGYCTGKVTQLVTRLSQDEYRCTPRTIEASEDAH